MNAPIFRRAASAGEGVSRRQLIITATAVGGALMVGCSPTDLLAGRSAPSSGSPRTGR